MLADDPANFKSVTVRVIRNAQVRPSLNSASSSPNRSCRACRAAVRSRVFMRYVITLCLAIGLVIGIYKLYIAYRAPQVPSLRKRISPDSGYFDNVRDPNQFLYAIVFDAGSTGTRLHVYRFQKPSDPNSAHITDAHASVLNRIQYSKDKSKEDPGSKSQKSPRLVDEVFREVKPGLSAYASNPADAALTVEQLLLLAKDSVPRKLWQSTPVALYATAGLRLLSESVADSILNEIRLVFQSYPFPVCDDCVRILDGLDEGVYGWYAINYLLGLTDDLYVEQNEDLEADDSKPHDHKHTVGVVDLGGGSVQITFLAHAPYNIPPAFLHKMDKFGGEMTVYSHSYLGLGLNAARLEVLSLTTPSSTNSQARDLGSVGSRSKSISMSESRGTANEGKDDDAQPEKVNRPSAKSSSSKGGKAKRKDGKRSKRGDDSSSISSDSVAKIRSKREATLIPQPNVTYVSPCFFDGFVGSFRFQNVDVKVRSVAAAKVGRTDRFDQCYALARQVVTSPKFGMHPPREVRRMHFYIQSYFFDRAVDAELIDAINGGSVTLSDFEDAAKLHCGNDQVLADKQPFLCLDLCIIIAMLRDGFQFDSSSGMMVMKTIQNVELSWTLGAAFPLINEMARVK